MNPRLLLLLVAIVAALWVFAPKPDATTGATPPPEAEQPEEEPAVADVDVSPEERVAAEGEGPVFLVTGSLRRAAPGAPAEEAQPAVGATVTVELQQESKTRLKTEAITEADGSFRVEFPTTVGMKGRIRVATGSTDTHRWARDTFKFDAGDSGRPDCHLIQRAVDDLTGRVTDPAGQPIAGATFTIKDVEGDRTAVTDEQGEFVLEHVRQAYEVRLSKEGYAVVRMPESLYPDRELGTWPEPDMVLAPTATLRIHVLDSNDEPVEGIYLGVRISPAELYGGRTGRAQNEENARGQSDASGLCLLEGTFANFRLLIRRNGEEFEYVEPDGTITHAEEGTQTLVLEPGEIRDLRFVLGNPITLSGRVFEPTGEPSPKANVFVRGLDFTPNGSPEYIGGTRTDEDGYFTLSEIPDVPVTRLSVAAEGTMGAKPSLSPFGGPKPPDPLHYGFVVLEQEQWDEPIELHLKVLHKITGRVVDSEGSPVSANLRLHPHTWDHDPGQGKTPRQRRSGSSEGRFEFKGIFPGMYDIEVESDGRATHWVRDVPSNQLDLLITLDDTEPIRVTIEVSCEVPLEQIVILRATLTPGDPDAIEAPELPKSQRYDTPGGWPEEATGVYYGGSRYSTGLGRVVAGSWPIDGQRVTLDLSEGYYWLGASGRTEAGHYCFRMGTGLVKVTPGDHDLHFVLEPSGRLEGRVEGATDEIYLAVVLPDGTPLALDVRHEARLEFVPLAADGSFEVRSVPSRPLEVWVGTKEELREKRPRLREAISPEAGETERLELALR